jgi:hypothetical protein
VLDRHLNPADGHSKLHALELLSTVSGSTGDVIPDGLLLRLGEAPLDRGIEQQCHYAFTWKNTDTLTRDGLLTLYGTLIVCRYSVLNPGWIPLSFYHISLRSTLLKMS